ncbi:MAG: zinc ABC transporter substrate-binding protein [Thermodesulfobacteriota bacterium]
MKRLTCLLLLFTLLGPLQPQAAAQPPQVVATIFPVYDFVREIGGDLVDVTLLLPPGVEAHSFAPTPQAMLKVHGADLLLYTSEEMEPWVADLLRGLAGDRLPVVATAPDAAGLAEHNHAQHHHGGRDPHVWLDPLQAREMVTVIAKALARIDPVNSKAYQAAAARYGQRLMALDKEIRQGLAPCRLTTIISGGHSAFAHFCRRYGLRQLAAFPGQSPDARPSPRTITNLIATMEEIGSKVVFHEELLEPKVARIIAEESGASLLLLHGIHNVSAQGLARGESYISLMGQNLKNLRQGLQCQ